MKFHGSVVGGVAPTARKLAQTFSGEFAEGERTTNPLPTIVSSSKVETQVRGRYEVTDLNGCL
jgi:hypothetical protein